MCPSSDVEINLRTPVREIPCPDDPPCDVVHREHTGEQTVEIAMAGFGLIMPVSGWRCARCGRPAAPLVICAGCGYTVATSGGVVAT